MREIVWGCTLPMLLLGKEVSYVARSNQFTGTDLVVQELHEIKLLLIVGLMKNGVTQNDIAALLGVSVGKMSGMLPSGPRSFRPTKK